jgi:hypothetical protein
MDTLPVDTFHAYRPVEGHAESCGRSHDAIESSSFDLSVRDASYYTFSVDDNTGSLPKYM